jgi:hypothetical protein
VDNFYRAYKNYGLSTDMQAFLLKNAVFKKKNIKTAVYPQLYPQIVIKNYVNSPIFTFDNLITITLKKTAKRKKRRSIPNVFLAALCKPQHIVLAKNEQRIFENQCA